MYNTTDSAAVNTIGHDEPRWEASAPLQHRAATDNPQWVTMTTRRFRVRPMRARLGLLIRSSLTSKKSLIKFPAAPTSMGTASQPHMARSARACTGTPSQRIATRTMTPMASTFHGRMDRNQ